MDLRCETCGAALVVTAAERTARCPYCGSPSIVERAPTRDRPDPTFTLPFVVGQERAREIVRGWLSSRGFFRTPELRHATIEEMRGVYVPAYLYAAVARSTYRARIGEDYQETETYTTKDSDGNTVTRTRTVTKTEWCDLAGRHASYVMDVVVTASRGLANAELEAVEPFDLRQMRRYSPALLSGWIAEEPTLTLDECVRSARDEALAKIRRELDAFMPGDKHADLTFETTLEHEAASLTHVPVWVLAARHDPRKPAVRILVNGQTGLTYGKAPLAWVRIVVVAVVVVVAIVCLVVALTRGGAS